MTTILALVVLGLLLYAGWVFFQRTPADDSIPKRVWGAFVLMAGAIGALITSWFGGTAP